MPQAFEHCNNRCPQTSDSLASMCWPITRQANPLVVMDQGALTQNPRQTEVRWPISEPWRRNLQRPRCEGEGRCQGDARRCNSKYRYGVDDVGPCPSNDSCRDSYRCGQERSCPNPCEPAPDCQKRTTRCFEWPQAQKNRVCPNENPNDDLRPRRANLNIETDLPERCPTCKRIIVDMECGPLSFNY